MHITPMYGYPSAVPYVSAQWRAQVTKSLLIVGAAISAGSILALCLEFFIRPLSEEEQLSDNPGGLILALLQMGLGLLQVLVSIATIVFFLMWLHRSYKNLPAFGARSTNYSPGWAVGSFFIPFANLFIPYRAMKELWQKSAPESSFLMSASPGAIFPLWWLFWILSNIAGNACFRTSFAEHPNTQVVTIACATSDALNIMASIFAIAVVNEIQQRQDETSKSLGVNQYPQVPLPPLPTGYDIPSQAQDRRRRSDYSGKTSAKTWCLRKIIDS